MKIREINFIIIIAILFLSIYRVEARDFAHIFTSKGIYETSEDLWFKCIVLDDSTFRLSDKIHTAFVEIVNSSDSVVWEEKYPVVNGECDGQIYIGDEWETGEYRMYVNTRNTLGITDSVMFPKKLLIVRELPEVQNFVLTHTHANHSIRLDSDTIFRQFKPLKVNVELDSTEYHTRSSVKVKISVTDYKGTPVQAKVALSVYDRLYDYSLGNLGLLSHCYGWSNNNIRNVDSKNIFLPDGPISGKLKIKKDKKGFSPEGQFINVYDFSNKAGSLNLVETGGNGYFEVPYDIASVLDWDLLLKPVSGQQMKPDLVLDDSFASIDNVRKHSKDFYFSDIKWQDSLSDNIDSLDYIGRRVVKLDEVTINGRKGRYPKRNKFMGYLDSISTLRGGEWVCGCPAGQGTTFLNDYIPGYTHHPGNESYKPVKRSLPVKGKRYTIAKYTGGIYGADHLVDIKIIEYTGPRYSEEELLRMNGLWKGKGYYPSHEFWLPDEDDWIYGIADNRNTLFWNPELATNSQGEVSIEIKTSDINSRFILKGICWSTNDNSFGEFNITFNVVLSNKK
ncbi:MAG: hypothetical protein HDS83_08440 [Bacteroidales bacterium]|nr:hypothetical protein [Bacteroidales bacterium]